MSNDLNNKLKEKDLLYFVVLIFPLLGLFTALGSVISGSVGLYPPFIFFLVFFLVYITYVKKYSIIVFSKGSSAVVLYILVISVGNIQYILSDTRHFGITFTFFIPIIYFLLYMIFSSMKKKYEMKDLLVYLFYSFLLFYLMSFSAYFLKMLIFGGEYPEVALSNLFDFNIRTSLPFFGHPLETGYASAVVVTLSIILYSFSKTIKEKIFLIAIVLLGIFGVLVGGSRTAFLSLFLIMFFLVFRLYKLKFLILFALIFISFFPFWYPVLVDNISDSSVVEFLSFISKRENDSTRDLLTLNSRTYLWMPVLTYYVENFNILNFIFGYGYNAPAITGVSSGYAYIFPNVDKLMLESMHVHSLFLQIIFNYGLFGFILFFYIFYKIIAVINSKKMYIMNLLIICILTNSISSPFELLTIFFSIFFLAFSTVVLNKKVHAIGQVKNKNYKQLKFLG